MKLEQSLTAIFPILIVPELCLWSVDYDSKGNRIAQPTLRQEVDFYIGKELWKKPQFCDRYTVSHLKILTFEGFKNFTAKISSDTNYWKMIFPPSHQLIES